MTGGRSEYVELKIEQIAPSSTLVNASQGLYAIADLGVCTCHDLDHDR
jgi:hypothetical protein